MVESSIEASMTASIDPIEASIRVLHVDDDAGFLKSAKQILEMQGEFKVETALSVEEAMKKMRKKTFDLVVSDYQMPEKDGLEFLRELRASGNTVPFIMFTGRGREEVAVKALNLGADRYFNKVGDPEAVYGELSHSIYQVVKAKRSEEELGKSEEKYRSIVELAPNSIMTLDLKGRITSCNTVSTRLSGYSKDELVGKHFSKMGPIRARDIPKLLRMLPSTIRGKPPKPFEITFQHKDGTTRQGEVHISLMKAGDKATGIQAIMIDTTERKKMEETARMSESKSRTLLENLPQKIFFKDRNSVYISCNEKYARDLRIKSDDITGKTDYDFYSKELAEKYRADDKRIMKSGKTEEIDEKYVQDGQSTFIHTVKTPVKDEEGNVVGVLGIFWDVTKRKRIENKQKELFHNLSERVKELNCLYGIAELVGKPNISLEEILRGTNDLLATTWQYSDVTCFRIVFENREFKTKNFKETPWKQQADIKVQGKKVGSVEVYYLEEKPTIREGPFLKEERDLINAVAKRLGKFVEDKRTQDALKQSEEKYKRIVELAPDGIATMNMKGVVTSVNSAFLRLTGFSKDEIVGKHFTNVGTLRARDLPRYIRLFGSIVRGKIPSPMEFSYLRKDGTQCWGEAHSSLLKEGSKTVGFQAILRDTTERKKTLEKLKMLNEKLSVVGKVTRHDIRNKLQAVTGNAYLAKQTLTGDNRTLEYLEDVESSCGQMERILDFATNYEKLGVEELTYIDVEKSIEDAVSLTSTLKGVKLMNDCKGSVLLADSLLIKLFYNLIDNSLRHGKRVSQIRIFYEVDKEQMKLIYEDDGVGIPKAEKEMIFKQGYGIGTGYGLWLIQKMCEVYDWSIKETGKQGKGARFTMTVPKKSFKLP